ncbi:hypothetical protein PUN28_004052 [Cardiocondyla obscurior]|uniref:Uncharacterized protein n=1 Tax=Cardiocondyla obscurior TaxID=286306 RepID=A0AAW2GLI7_9HYME
MRNNQEVIIPLSCRTVPCETNFRLVSKTNAEICMLNANKRDGHITRQLMTCLDGNFHNKTVRAIYQNAGGWQ